MSLKENVQMVKNELSSEEKFFESAVITERFIKRNKHWLIATAIGLVLVTIGWTAYSSYQSSQVQAANVAFNTLQQSPNDAKARETLSSISPELYQTWLLASAVASSNKEELASLQKSTAPAVADIASYQLAALDKNVEALDAYAYKQEAIYRDLALVDSAVLLIEDGKIKEAHDKLALISMQSPLYQLANILKHYGVQ